MTGVVDHLERQLASSRRLLGIVLSQGESIRGQDVEGVLARLADLQGEMANRQRLEAERDELLRHAGAALGTAPDAVDLESLLALVPGNEALRARALSSELRGLVGEVSRVHEENRVLIRQELAFLDHLMRALSGAPQAGYSPTGYGTAAQASNVVDARV